MIGVPLSLSLILIACGSGTAAIPTTGAGVCDGLRQAQRFRYVFDYAVESPKPIGPVDESAVGSPPFAITPTFDDYNVDIKHDGSDVQPDRLDYELSTPNSPAVRTIRIGQRQWISSGGAWQELNNPGSFPFLPPLVCDDILSTLDLATATGTAEQVDNTSARHFRFAGVTLDTSSKLLGPQSDEGRLLKSYDVDLWLGQDDGRLVKVEATSTAAYPSARKLTMKITLDVSSYNDDAIVIQPPA